MPIVERPSSTGGGYDEEEFLNAEVFPTLALEALGWGDGGAVEAVRITIDEPGRHKVGDVLVDGLGPARRPIRSVEYRAVPSMGSMPDQQLLVMQFDEGAAGAWEIILDPELLTVELLRDGHREMSFNGRSQFHIERLVSEAALEQKQTPTCTNMCFAEQFRGHTDSKPNGPTAVMFDLGFEGYSHVYGIPEHATPLSLEDTRGKEPYRMYNLDVFKYLDDSPAALYGSIPFMWSHKPGSSVGAFFLNSAEMWVDVLKGKGNPQLGTRDRVGTQWIAESGQLDLFLLMGPGPADVSRQYARLTGGTPLPQLFSLGYHQCRWNYKNEADVSAVDGGFDEHGVPYDVLWLDIEHTDGKRYQTWDSALFPTPQRMQRELAAKGRKMVTIIDPHVKIDEDYVTHKLATEQKYYVLNSDGETDFEGWCWPGAASYLDVMHADIREWWAQQFSLANYSGSTETLYTWNDMNEPSVFNGPEITMQKDLVHRLDSDRRVEHRDVHNAFGMHYHQATANGHVLRGRQVYGEDADRPFVLSRAFFSGTQRHGPIWTGDNAANWDHLRVSLPMVLSINLAGLPFSGADVGGFFGDPSPELLTRWYQVGIFYPFFRGHAHLDTRRREPWLFGEEVLGRIRAAIRMRYTLLPYLYTLFYETSQNGAPVMRPMWYEFPSSKALAEVQDQFMFGPALLIAPVLKKGPNPENSTASGWRQVLLPTEARWYDFRTGQTFDSKFPSMKYDADLDTIPIFFRGGHILPRRETARRSSQAMQQDPFTLVVGPDADGKAVGRLYLDDGRSYAYENRAEFLLTEFSFENNLLKATPTAGGELRTDVLVDRIVVLGVKSPKKWSAKTHAGQSLECQAGPISLQGSWDDGQALVVRRTGLRVAEPWSVQFTEVWW